MAGGAAATADAEAARAVDAVAVLAAPAAAGGAGFSTGGRAAGPRRNTLVRKNSRKPALAAGAADPSLRSRRQSSPTAMARLDHRGLRPVAFGHLQPSRPVG